MTKGTKKYLVVAEVGGQRQEYYRFALNEEGAKQDVLSCFDWTIRSSIKIISVEAVRK